MMRLNSGATSITNTVSNDSGYYSNTRRYEPTPEERRAIQQAQAAVSEKRTLTAAFTEKAEQLIFRRQTQVLNQLSGVLAERGY
ncbi:hypothetical protein [Pantanalinema sp. GBBB05]|uniref:hypothetical protein n=1 Tax=Pantanalinema sp. GBBB05 TaxID=2604139 RepID=UPI001DB8BFC5|nr:hypothetical protein [Pantanalinema sp. GBBB05]